MSGLNFSIETFFLDTMAVGEAPKFSHCVVTIEGKRIRCASRSAAWSLIKLASNVLDMRRVERAIELEEVNANLVKDQIGWKEAEDLFWSSVRADEYGLQRTDPHDDLLFQIAEPSSPRLG